MTELLCLGAGKRGDAILGQVLSRYIVDPDRWGGKWEQRG